MTDVLFALLIFWAPVLALALLSLFWAKRSRVNWLRRPLRWGAFFWAPVLTICIASVIATAATCDGNALYGYGGCSLFSNEISNAITPIALLVYATAAFYIVALFLIGFIAELRTIPKS